MIAPLSGPIVTATKPANQICPVCAHGDDVTVLKVEDDWVMTCEDGCHPLFEWKPTMTKAGVSAHRSGLGEELGVYDTLLACVAEGAAEYGVIEYRFVERDRGTYDVLVQRYGHRAKEPRKYTASSFLGGALGQLWREQLITGWFVPATGYWKYNSSIGAYAPAGTTSSDELLSWERFATKQLHVDATSGRRSNPAPDPHLEAQHRPIRRLSE